MTPESTTFYGVTTVGTKGQIVIPREAREEMGLRPGEKVIIIGKKNGPGGCGMIGVCQVGAAQKLVDALSEKVSEIQTAIGEANEK